MGFPYSYTAQFENAGGVRLIQNPYRASSALARLVAWMFTLWKDRYTALERIRRKLVMWLRRVVTRN
jgi:hypothetical protein